jgi:hypothetical protein
MDAVNVMEIALLLALLKSLQKEPPLPDEHASRSARRALDMQVVRQYIH